MSYTVYQSCLVIYLLVQHTGEISVNLVYIRPIPDILLQMVEHVGNLDIGATVKRTFQGTDARSDGRIGISSGRGRYAYGERRVVTAAMLRLQHQQQVKGTGIQFRIILFQHIQEILRERKTLLRMPDMQRTAVSGMAKHIESIGYDGGELRNKVYALAHQIIARRIIGIRVKAVHLEHASRQDIHYIIPFKLDDVHLRFLFQRHIIVNQLTERSQFLPVGQTA